ncbi:lipase family protein [Nocardia sp. CDC159]|uniref:Lipase family protein n=1 Tax=Nocardia pulmonis TaxID=2951408 RepID=A0A9X2E6X4_9NOCA|nr:MULTISPECIES: lipase family protein [Nocardia]MCM6774771.1 lipase family protein [Nocardia pulmonis]MCM6789702.1 lipase family protein [Nocardia sp. CDC159]
MAARWRAVARLWVVTVLAAVSVGAPVFVGAEESIAEFVDPPHELAAVLPTPLPDPFYVPPADFESRSPATLLRARSVPSWFTTPVRAIQLLVRSTDSKGKPVPVVATLMLPKAPWTGAGPRPLVSYNIPISSLGHWCAPSYTLERGFSADQLSIQLLLDRNYAVIVPDHQGPRQAYAAGLMGGHAVLDAARAAVRLGMPELEPKAPVVISGYSGGAIATGWAAQLAPEYAPELNLVGALVGGTPADYDLLVKIMNGRQVGSGVLLGATLGLAREYPELLGLLNDNGWRLAHLFRDVCSGQLAALGTVPVRLEQLTDVPDPTELPMVRKIVADNRLGAIAPKVPTMVYHGKDEFWVPYEGVRNLYHSWCGKGAQVRLAPYPGEHFVVGAMAVPAVSNWVTELLEGELVPPGCTVAVP